MIARIVLVTIACTNCLVNATNAVLAGVNLHQRYHRRSLRGNDMSDDANTQADVPLPLIPYPTSVERVSSDRLHLGGTVRVKSPSHMPALVEVLKDFALRDVSMIFDDAPSDGDEVLLTMALKDGGLDDESYDMEVSDKAISLNAGGEHGLFNSIMTLGQLVTKEAESEAASLPLVRIADSPAYSWRGLHLDVSRHFFPAENVTRLLDTMARFKLNHFHWHLTDDQGWRLPIDKWPELANKGAWRTGTMIGHDEHSNDGIPHGGSYTREDIQRVLEHARKLHITVMPEVDVPGHCTPVVAAYPELGNRDARFVSLPKGPATTWGLLHNTLSPTPKTFNLLQDIFTDVTHQFESPYIHAGGDEVPTDQWQESEVARGFAEEKGLTTSSLQRFFTDLIVEDLRKQDRTPVFWDEVLSSDTALDKSAVIMAWTGDGAARTALGRCHPLVVALMEYTYFDRVQSRSQQDDSFGGLIDIEKVYQLPIDRFQDMQQCGNVLGGQAQLWSEYYKNWDRVEEMAFPRSLALAEVLWAGRGKPGYEHFAQRLGPRVAALRALGVNAFVEPSDETI